MRALLLPLLIVLVGQAPVATAQERVWRVGLPTNGRSVAIFGSPTEWGDEVLQTLARTGLVERRNLELVDRYSEGDTGRLAALGEIVRLAAKHRLRALYEHRAFVEASGLMSYGTDIDRMSYRAAVYVDKILKDAMPGELTIEQPTATELVINLATARSLGLMNSPVALDRADEVVE